MNDEDKKLYPEGLTFFTTKKDAGYDGDPEGDFILAEHMNDVQEAITRIEKAVGTFPSTGGSISEHIQNIEGERPMRVPSVGYFPNNLVGELTSIQAALSQYDLVLLGNIGSNTKNTTNYLNAQGTTVFGVLDAREPLVIIQNNISQRY